jgi:hypothetical protein
MMKINGFKEAICFFSFKTRPLARIDHATVHSVVTVWSILFVTVIALSFRKGYISKSTSAWEACSETELDLDGSEFLESNLSSVFLEVLGPAFLKELRERLEKTDLKPSMMVCIPMCLRAPDNDGRHTAVRAKQASMYIKYSPAVETTVDYQPTMRNKLGRG